MPLNVKKIFWNQIIPSLNRHTNKYKHTHTQHREILAANHTNNTLLQQNFIFDAEASIYLLAQNEFWIRHSGKIKINSKQDTNQL